MNKKQNTGEAMTPRPSNSNLETKKILKQHSNVLEELTLEIAELKEMVSKHEKNILNNRATIVVFHGDLDHVFSSFIIANGAASMDYEVSLYFTFWSLNILKKKCIYKKKSFMEKAVTLAMPKGVNNCTVSKMNWLGLGTAFFKKLMKKKNVLSLEEMISLSKEMDIKLIACAMTMGIMGITKEELIDGIELGGVGSYLGDALDSKLTLFI